MLKGGASIAVLIGPHNVLVNTGFPGDKELLLKGILSNRMITIIVKLWCNVLLYNLSIKIN